MDRVTSLIFRGLENDDLVVRFTDNRQKFDIKSVFDTFDSTETATMYDEWILTFDYHREDEDVEGQQYEFTTLAFFLRALEFCSNIASEHIVEISFVLYLFQVRYVDVQWVERELCEIVSEGKKPTIPESQAYCILQDEVEELKRQLRIQGMKIKLLKAKGIVATNALESSLPKKRVRIERDEASEDESQ